VTDLPPEPRRSRAAPRGPACAGSRGTRKRSRARAASIARADSLRRQPSRSGASGHRGGRGVQCGQHQPRSERTSSRTRATRSRISPPHQSVAVGPGPTPRRCRAWIQPHTTRLEVAQRDRRGRRSRWIRGYTAPGPASKQPGPTTEAVVQTPGLRGDAASAYLWCRRAFGSAGLGWSKTRPTAPITPPPPRRRSRACRRAPRRRTRRCPSARARRAATPAQPGPRETCAPCRTVRKQRAQRSGQTSPVGCEVEASRASSGQAVAARRGGSAARREARLVARGRARHPRPRRRPRRPRRGRVKPAGGIADVGSRRDSLLASSSATQRRATGSCANPRQCCCGSRRRRRPGNTRGAHRSNKGGTAGRAGFRSGRGDCTPSS